MTATALKELKDDGRDAAWFRLLNAISYDFPADRSVRGILVA
jgi:hypothetical protein